MRHLSILIATLVLACFALFPGTALADTLDDLDVTMEVIDDIAGIDAAVSEMRGPGDENIEGGGEGVEDGPAAEHRRMFPRTT